MGGGSEDAGVVVGGWVVDGTGGAPAVARGNFGLTPDAGIGEVVAGALTDGCAPEELGLG